MTAVYLNSTMNDDARRGCLYEGDIFLCVPTPATLELVDFAMELLSEAFAPYAPREAQFHMSVEEWVARFGPAKPRFIHHSRTRDIMKRVVLEAGCDPQGTYLDVPRLRGVTSDRYLTSGVGYAHHAHRDTWYSAPFQQLNWWLPLHELPSNASMAFHHACFDVPVKNGSADFNYYDWNAVGRKTASQHIGTDTRKQPKPLEDFDAEPSARYLPPPAGMVVFSAQQMHSTVPNTSGLTRFSIDFRTVHRGDVERGRGAPNVDTACTGTSLRDFRSLTGDETLPEDVVAKYDAGPFPEEAQLVFAATGATHSL